MKAISQRSAISRLFGVLAALVMLLGAQPATAVLMWEPLAPFSDPRRGGAGIEGAAASLIGTKIYVSNGCCGDNAFLSIYDIPTDTWTYGGGTAPDAFTARSEGAGGTALGKFYSIGGRPGIPGTGDAVEEFTPGGAWISMTAMTTPRRGLGTASVGGKIYAVGGNTGAAPGAPADANSVLEVFDPTVGVGGTWTTKAAMPVPVADAEATVGIAAGSPGGGVAGRIYVFGGTDGAGTTVGTTQIYDIATDTWSLGAPMPTARSNGMAGVIDLGVAEDGMIAVFGGLGLSVTELYDPVADTWMAGPAMLITTAEMAVGMLWDATGVYSIGVGPFGASGMFVERLVDKAVPEPSSPALLGFGMLLLFAVTRMRRRTRTQ